MIFVSAGTYYSSKRYSSHRYWYHSSTMSRNDIHKPLIHQRTTFSLLVDKTDEARRVLASRPSGVLGEGTTVSDKYMVKKANIRGIIFPWMPAYEIWWTITAVGAIFTVFFCPFQIAFQDEPGTFNDASAVLEWGLNLVFFVDIIVNFNLAFYTNNEVMVYDRYDIFIHYFSRMFWVDLIGVFPFETVALMLAGDLGDSNNEALLFSLLRLLRFVRLHRMKKLSDVLQYNARVSLMWFTLIRNFASVLCSTHLAACSMYFLARYNGFGENTWLGPVVRNMSGLERYVTALYWAIVTFCTCFSFELLSQLFLPTYPYLTIPVQPILAYIRRHCWLWGFRPSQFS